MQTTSTWKTAYSYQLCRNSSANEEQQISTNTAQQLRIKGRIATHKPQIKPVTSLFKITKRRSMRQILQSFYTVEIPRTKEQLAATGAKV
ncbi:hypothetical protein Trydic_g17662 [Trypoxylus dichotomus]